MKYKIVRSKPTQSPRAKKAMTMAKEMGLTDEERYELCRMLPGVDPDTGGSWKDLSEEQLHDLLCYLEGFLFIHMIYRNRGES